MNQDDTRLGILIRDNITMDRPTWALHQAVWAIITGNGVLFQCELRKDEVGKAHLFVPKQTLDPSKDPAFGLATPRQRENLGALGPVTSSDFIRKALLHETGIVEVEPDVFVHTHKVFRVVKSEEGDAVYISDPIADEWSRRPKSPKSKRAPPRPKHWRSGT